jgi:bla regulator protein blaR1
MLALNTLFDWVMEATVRGSLVVAGVLTLQWALRRWVGPRFIFALWLPVLFVLMTPLFPESRWSVGTVLQPAQPTVEMKPEPALPMVALPLVNDEKPISPPKPSIDWSAFRVWAWSGGAVCMLLLFIGSLWLTLRRYRASRVPLTESLARQITVAANEVGLRKLPSVWLCTEVKSPAVAGLLRPVLLLPEHFESQFKPAEARLVLLHELMHLKRHDLVLNALLCVLMALHWFNPLLWIAFWKARADREAACDAQVLENATPQCRADYGHALLKAETAFSPLRLGLGFVGLFQRGSALRARIQFIANHQPSTHPTMKLITLTCITALTFLGVTRAETKQRTNEAASLIAIELKMISFKQVTDWTFKGKPDSKEAKPYANYNLTEQERDTLLNELSARQDAGITSYPRMVVGMGKEATFRSVVNQPFEKAKDKIAYESVGFEATFTPRLDSERIVMPTNILQGVMLSQDPLVVSKVSFQKTLEAEDGASCLVMSWKDGKAETRQPVLYLLSLKTMKSMREANGFNIGQSVFRPGDGIRLREVTRDATSLTVTADYELQSADEASICLFITSKGAGKTKVADSQTKKITKGKGTVTLHHPDIYEGLPHVSFYGAKDGQAMGGIYFGTEEEAENSKRLGLSYQVSE